MSIGIQELRDIDRFFAQKQYDRAIEFLEKIIEENPSENSLKLKLADGYFLYGKNKKAISVLKEIAESYASVGFITKAMAVQKKIQRIDPSVEVDIYKYIEESDSSPVAKTESIAASKKAPPQEKQDPSFLTLDKLFKGLKKDEFAEIYQKLDEQNTAAGEIVFDEGDSDNSVYIIIQGSVEVIVDHDGGEVQLAVLKEGNFFGEVALLTGRSRTATVRSVEDSTFLVLNREKFLAMSEQYPGLQENFAAALERRAQSAIETLLKYDLEKNPE